MAYLSLCVAAPTLLALLQIAWLARARHLQPHRHHHMAQNTQDLALDTSLAFTQQRANKAKRQALDLAVGRLHILESLDPQLRAFANRQLAPVDKPLMCRLELPFASHARDQNKKKKKRRSKRSQTQHRLEAKAARNCLHSEQLRRQIPPYMLNLHRQLLVETRTQDEAVRAMPYRSTVARSFAQPPLRLPTQQGGEYRLFVCVCVGALPLRRKRGARWPLEPARAQFHSLYLVVDVALFLAWCSSSSRMIGGQRARPSIACDGQTHTHARTQSSRRGFTRVLRPPILTRARAKRALLALGPPVKRNRSHAGARAGQRRQVAKIKFCI